MSEAMTTYEAWREIVIKAQSESVELRSRVYIHFRKQYGWATSTRTLGDHYASAFGMNRVEVNRQVAKKLGRLWLR